MEEHPPLFQHLKTSLCELKAIMVMHGNERLGARKPWGPRRISIQTMSRASICGETHCLSPGPIWFPEK